MGFQNSDRFIHPSLINHETCHADDPTASMVKHLDTSSSGREYAREGSGSPQLATDNASIATASPVPSAGDSGPENTSNKSCFNDQEPLNLKAHSLRQRTAQACDKCRERKTKCSGHRPVCTRCTNRGLICEYKVRESRARSTMRHRTNPSPNPFQVNYRNGGGWPTPAYHSRMGHSQTNAYARSPNDYASSFDHSIAPRLPSFFPSASSSTDQLPRDNDLDMHYARHSAHLRKHPDMRRDLKGWDLDPLAQSQASYLERQRAVQDFAYGSGISPIPQEKDALFSHGYMGRNSMTSLALNPSIHDMQLDERIVLHGMPSTTLLETAYRQCSAQVHDSFSFHKILLTILRSDGTITSSEDGPDLSSGSTSSTSSRCPSGLSTERETFGYAEDDAASLSFRVRGYPSANLHTEWDKLCLSPSHSQEASMFTTVYDAAIVHYNSPYSGYDKSTMANAMREILPGQSTLCSNMGSQVDSICLAPSLSLSTDAYRAHVTERSVCIPQDGFQNPALYDLLAHDAPENMHSHGAPTVSDPGNRFEGFKFFK